MAVVVVSRWKGDPQNMKIFREGAPNLKRHGAVSARVGQCWAGPYAGQIYGAITFPDWESYGKGVQALLADPEAQRIYGEITKNFELQERSVLMVEGSLRREAPGDTPGGPPRRITAARIPGMCGDCGLDHDSALILPRHIEFVEALSLTVSGKIRRTEPRGGGRNGRRIRAGRQGSGRVI